MTQDSLTRPGNLVFPSNLVYLHDLEAAGGRVVRQPTGHLLLYGAHGRRILATDPEGHPLHECEWTDGPSGIRLTRARIRLDWNQWIGLKPGALVNATMLDLSKKPGWERIGADDLRQMAAQALRVPIEEVRFFYGDDDLRIHASGQATIRHRKDALYILEHGRVEDPPGRFMACMGAMHWSRIDFLPVVELFQSLLPGTGSAVFEFIRGLYDDQNPPPHAPLPLRYRGMPTYPSEAAYRLFSAFFMPQAPGGGDPFPIFMDPSHSHLVTWLPTADPPRRYFHDQLCVTIKASTIEKVTLADDPTGLPFVRPRPNGFALGDRSVVVRRGRLVLRDGRSEREVPLDPSWGSIAEGPPAPPPSSSRDWRAFFGETPPQVPPQQAFSAVLLYPDDEREITEPSSQPFVADFVQDLMEAGGPLTDLGRADRILIDRFDAVVMSCIRFDRARDYTVVYERASFAQKQAQLLWHRLAELGRLDWGKRIRFLPASAETPPETKTYEAIYRWVPFSDHDRAERLSELVQAVADALAPGGVAFLAGPENIGSLLGRSGLRLVRTEPVAALPTFHLHQAILPKARLKSGLTFFFCGKP